MAELATIARPYAEALFKASSSDLAATAAWMDGLGVIAENEQLQQLASNPKITEQAMLDVIASVAGALPAPAHNLLRTVLENGRFVALPEIAKQFRTLKNAQSGSSDAVIYSAFAMYAGSLSELALLLEKRFERKLNASVVVEPELIGGIRVVVGDEVLDTSVKARLEQMKVALTA